MRRREIGRNPSQKTPGLTWREHLFLVNSALFCVVGAATTARYLTGGAGMTVALLGMALVFFGAYRLALARRELKKRADDSRRRT